MRKYIIIGVLAAFSFQLWAQKKPIDYVNVFIGTGQSGNTYPGAQAPFGMISISPSNTFDDYNSVDARPGYKYAQKEIRGFGLTHFSGVGCHAMQDLMFLPLTGKLDSSPVNNRNAYKSAFSHQDEKANPGYYQVGLKDYQLNTRFATSQRAGIGEIDYNGTETPRVIFIPTNSANGIANGEVHIDKAKNTVSGWVSTGGFCWRDPAYLPYKIYFVMKFNAPITESGVWIGKQKFAERDTASGNNFASYISFKNGTKKVKLRTALSFVSTENALLNLNAETPTWDFNNVLSKTQSQWANYLNKITVDGGTDDQKSTFYTAVYHNLLQANVFNDVNQQYFGADDKIHTIEKGRNKYVNFSLWDTYRTTAYLQSIIAPKESSDMIQSLLLDAQQGGALPNWSMNSQEYGVMNGYSPFPFVANMYAMGARNFDLMGMKDMMKKVSMNYYANRGNHGWLNIEEYKKLGYVPFDKNGLGTSMTMEYGIDDYSIAKICEAAGDKEAMNYYLKRSQNVFNLYNPTNKLLQGRNADGKFIEPFDLTTEKGYNEGNAIQYFWSVPHSMKKLVETAGGKKFIESRLDTFMSKIEVGWAPQKPHYWLGNEPCFGATYVYNYLQTPWKAQDYNREIVNKYYTNSPEGLSGDDDAGAMSALYVFSAMGFYPYIPGESGFMISGPLFKKTTIKLANGKTVTINGKNAEAKNAYIQKMSINGKPNSNLWLDWNLMQKGAVVDFTMGEKPNRNWGNKEADAPPSYR
ncbi:GH92 family glycosyl hydrolase [Pedobacter sp. UYP30]|uniref:GH92 family glycosyl hydrolase n=1 Tax=Pedobacter sp. UYP30 TaxID=1756400 RepID=UPI003397375B